ncbi:hypothetical protein MUO66_06715 [Candidatus Bathyarchaeota archaeon]|nr:hypothetical protein [Candidatus Bathyarchaeota archaeon]
MKKLSYLFYIIILALFLIFLYHGCGEDDSPVNGENGSTTVTGTLTLPAAAASKTFFVAIDYDRNGDNGFKYSVTGTCGAETTENYTISNVAAGNYYIYAVVFVSGDISQGPQSGDYLGFYGGTISNPPNSPNASVPASGTVTFDINLEVMP